MQPYWEKNGVRLYLGDALDLLPDLKADVLITDPPYNAKKSYGEGTDDDRPWDEWCRWWDRCLELMAWSAPNILAFMSQTAYRRYLRMGRHEPDWTLVWSKPLSLSVCAMPFMPHWEAVGYWGQTRKRDGAFWGSDVVTCNVVPNKYGHPTEKPLRLMLDLVSRFEGVIGDPFAGSGTTLEAALILGKSAWGIEIEERWLEVAARRLEYGVASRDGQQVMNLWEDGDGAQP